ncbi:hypothetical protein IWQ55_000280 [Labrenzia sp. EL_208]|nr:hypothetical protein [Labrenzia sp. EL_132]MBG6227088.1 hypothetical protein [Labrenzia sp. EL_208]
MHSDGDTFEYAGHSFCVGIEPDDWTCGAPWEGQDLLGDVSEWTRDPKAPGQMVLNGDSRWNSRQFYEFQSAVKNARSGGLSGSDADKAAREEFAYLRRWCLGEWHYAVVTVTLCDDYGDPIEDLQDSCGGVEYGNVTPSCQWDIEHILDSLAQEVLANLECRLKRGA